TPRTPPPAPPLAPYTTLFRSDDRGGEFVAGEADDDEPAADREVDPARCRPPSQRAQQGARTTGAVPTIGGVRTISTAGTVSALRSEEHTSELQSRGHLVCRLL